MQNKQLIDYIAQQRLAGINDPDTAQTLRKNGWTEEAINQALLTSPPVHNKLLQRRGVRIFMAGIVAALSFYAATFIILAPLMVLGVVTLGILVWFVLFIAAPVALVVAVIVANITGRRLLRRHAVAHSTAITVISSLTLLVLGVFFFKTANTSEPGMPIILGALSLLAPGALFVFLDMIFNSAKPGRWPRIATGGSGIIVLVLVLLVFGLLYHPNHGNDTRLIASVSNLPYTLYIPNTGYQKQVYEVKKYGKVSELIIVDNPWKGSTFIDEYQDNNQDKTSFPCYDNSSQTNDYTCTYLEKIDGMDVYSVFTDYRQAYDSDPQKLLVSYAARKGTTLIVGTIQNSNNDPDKEKSVKLFKQLVASNSSLLLEQLRRTQPSQY